MGTQRSGAGAVRESLVPERQRVELLHDGQAAVASIASHINARDVARIAALLQPLQEGGERSLSVPADTEVSPQELKHLAGEDAVAGAAQDDGGGRAGAAFGGDLLHLVQQKVRLLAVLVVDVADGDADHIGPGQGDGVADSAGEILDEQQVQEGQLVARSLRRRRHQART
jgi:hypothetical protein